MGAYSSLTTFIDEVVAVDDTTVEIRCSKPKANLLRTWIPILPEHIWAEVKPALRRRRLPQQAADHRHGSVPGHRGQER